MNEEDKAIAALLEDALVAWRTKQTRARANVSLNSFADYLGVGRSLLKMWLSGERSITDDKRKKIARPVADLMGPETYKIMGVIPPDPLLQVINSRWPNIPEDKQQKLAELAEQYERESLKNGSKNAHKQRKTQPY